MEARRVEEEVARRRLKAEKQRRDDWDAFTREAGQCGVQLQSNRSGRFVDTAGNSSQVRFLYTLREHAHAAFLLTRACGESDIKEPCNDGMAAIERHWSDEKFWDAIFLGEGSDKELIGCFWHVHDNVRPTGDFGKLRREIARHHQALEAARQKARTKEQKERERQERNRRTEESNRRYQEREEERRRRDRASPEPRDRCGPRSDAIPYCEVPR